jgi:hypothetical protein
MYDDSYVAADGTLRTSSAAHRVRVPLRTWGGVAKQTEPTWQDFAASRRAQITATLKRKQLSTAGAETLRPRSQK